jgi:cytoskeletal protein CcmA (bactofilin family)
MRKKKQQDQGAAQTVIGVRVKFTGEMESDGSVHVNGILEGQAKVGSDLVIGEQGRIKGDVVAENVLVAGSVVGNVHARGRLEILPTGMIEGDVEAESLIVDEGGVLHGRTSMASSRRPSNTTIEQTGVVTPDLD